MSILKEILKEPKIIDGAAVVDDRGFVSFVNDFDFNGVKRFYAVENHEKGFIRAWHGHKKEEKYVYVSKGVVLFATMPLVTDYKMPQKFVLSERRPQILHVPAGYYNGFKTLTENAKIMFFSTSTLEESKNDDFRLSADICKDIWTVRPR